MKLVPSIEEIQKSINRASLAVLRCSKTLYNWNKAEAAEGRKVSLYDLITQDKEIVKMVLLLMGSIQGTKNKVTEVLSRFGKFEWVWKKNIHASLKEFKKDGAQLYSYEHQLNKFNEVETEVEAIQPTFVIGAMILKTGPLRQSLKVYFK